MDVSKICGDITKKEIILYGEQEEIKQFLDAYCGILNIHTAITEYKDEVILQPYAKWDVKVALFDKTILSEEQLVIICSPNKFGLLKRRLDYSGKKEYKDYISWELADHILYRKKLMVCMGTQLIGQTCLFLNENKLLTSQYSIIYYPESELMEAYKNRLLEYIHVCRCCSVYIRSSCEKEQFALKILGRTVLSETCKIILVSDYGFGGYYPQITKDRNTISDYLLREYERLSIDYETLAFSRIDKEILNLCLQNVSIDNIVEKIMDDKFYPKEYIEQFFFNEIRQFEQMENNTDIRLAGYIREQHTECLCRNLNEWNEPVIFYVYKAILEILNIHSTTIVKDKRILILENNSGSELPIYPSVQKALGLSETLRNKKYRIVTYNNIEYMTLDKYLYFLTDYLYKAIDFVEFTGMKEERLFTWKEEEDN